MECMYGARRARAINATCVCLHVCFVSSDRRNRSLSSDEKTFGFILESNLNTFGLVNKMWVQKANPTLAAGKYKRYY